MLLGQSFCHIVKINVLLLWYSSFKCNFDQVQQWEQSAIKEIDGGIRGYSCESEVENRTRNRNDIGQSSVLWLLLALCYIILLQTNQALP